MSNALLLNIKRMNFFLKQRLEDPDLDSSKLTLYQQSANQLLLELKTNETIPESAKETSSKILYDLARLISAKETSLLRSVTRIPSVDESIATRVQRKAGSIYKTVVLQGHVECEENDKAAARNIQGLLQQQKSTVSVEMHDELRYHQQLTAELAELTQVLKENTLSMSETIAHQNIVSHLIVLYLLISYSSVSRWTAFKNTRRRISSRWRSRRKRLVL